MTVQILRLISVAVLLLGLDEEAAAETTERAGVLVKSIILPSRSFDERTLRLLAREEIQRLGPIGSCLVQFTSESSGAPLPKPSHIRFSTRRRLYEEIARVPVQYAELLKVGGDSVLRIRNQHTIKNIALDGHDPRLKRFGGVNYEILYIVAPPHRTMQASRANVYVRSDSEPEVQGGLRLLAEFGSLFPDREVHVYVRRDGFFVEEPSYPFVNPLVASISAPSEEEYSLGKTLRCFLKEKQPFCSSD